MMTCLQAWDEISAKDARLALHTLFDCGRFSINVDLIRTGIPGQGIESAVSDMLVLMKEGVDQVAAYAHGLLVHAYED